MPRSRTMIACAKTQLVICNKVAIFMRMFKKLYSLLGLVLLVGCATFVSDQLMQRFGAPQPTRFDAPYVAPATHPISYQQQVRPILEQRCVVCHACYDAPCQLKLGSFEGITRGATKQLAYDGARLLEAPPTRLFIDAIQPSQWREKDFFPVLNEFSDHSPTAEQHASLLARSLLLKQRHPLPENPSAENQTAPASLDFSLYRDNQCPSIDEYSDFENKNPLMGMPFGLPAISEAHQHTLLTWIKQGAPMDAAPPLSIATQQQVHQWEKFFNGDSNLQRLMSRYIYEHLFLAHLYFQDQHFKDQKNPRYFRLLRSRTPPGEPIAEIATRRPFDDPGVPRVYYRLQPVVESIVAKSHMPYALNSQRIARWTQLFLTGNNTIATLPGYEPELAANPFKTFQQLPINSRYWFLLDEAEFSVMGFIKGPVCRGQTALNVINDHFWVVFRHPDYVDQTRSEFIDQESHLLTLPAEYNSNAGIVKPWLHYSHQEKKYLQDKSRYLEQRLSAPGAVNLPLIWDGGPQHNANAALTIYRHFDNATVLKGFVGEKPKTAWVLNYALLERIHYLLTAGYDLFGNVGHQVNTRLYMNFLRMEGEFNFLMLLPQTSRIAVRDFWYRETDADIKELVYGRYAHFNRDTDIVYSGKQRPDQELLDKLQDYLAPTLTHQLDVNRLHDADLIQSLNVLRNIRGSALSWLPEASFLRIETPGKPALNLTLLRNTGHLNITHLITEHKTLIPAENSLDVLAGFASAYPNAIYRIQRQQLPEFIQQIAQLNSEADYQSLMMRFGVRRLHKDFWTISDALNNDYRQAQPIEAGLFDLNRLENR